MVTYGLPVVYMPNINLKYNSNYYYNSYCYTGFFYYHLGLYIV